MKRLVLVLACLVSVAAADPVYYVGHNKGPTSESPTEITDTGSLFVPGPPTATINWDATAGQGHLRSSVTVVHSNALDTQLSSGQSTAGFRYDDIIFTWNGPGPAPTNFIATLNIQLSGSLSGQANNFVDPGYNIIINTSVGSYSFQSGGAGILAGEAPGISAVNSTLTYDYVNVNVDTPVSLELALTAATSVFGGGSSSSLFGNSLHFVTNGPVFDVPDGITVNSISAGIVNNRFRLPAVPEPGALALVAVGLIAVLRRRRL